MNVEFDFIQQVNMMEKNFKQFMKNKFQNIKENSEEYFEFLKEQEAIKRLNKYFSKI